MPLARSSQINHPSGAVLKTPLLVPAFSSKGSRFTRRGRSEIADALTTSAEFLTDTMLVSAYDIHYKYIPHPMKFGLRPEITFIDSGGYETADEHDLSAVYRHTGPVKKWTETHLLRTLDKWPARLPAVFVSFDHGDVRKSLHGQIAQARKMFARYPDQLHEIILKPERRGERTLVKTLSKALSCLEDLRGFHLIGMTEKELGSSVLERMESIAKLRLALDRADIRVPLHIFGSLDPVTSCLYFISGAEVFDGLTWLRYSYVDGRAVYMHDYGALRIGIHEWDELVRARTLADNINYLQKLRFQMQAYLLQGDFRKFAHNGEDLVRAYDALCGKMGGAI